MNIDEKIRFAQSTIAPMAWHTYPHIAGILTIEESDAGRHIGSALRLSTGDRRAVVTAAHVIHEARGGSGRFAVTSVRGQSPFELHGDPDYIDEARDIAVYWLTDEYPSDGISFWSETRVDPSEDKLSTDYLFVHGFPAERSRFMSLLGGVVSKSFPYGVMMREDALPGDMCDFQFAMDFDPANMYSTDGKPADWLDPHGLSGSPVWRIGASGRSATEWTPESSSLVGIVTAWRPDEKLILATKIAHVSTLLASSTT